jgi:hypothetical protein
METYFKILFISILALLQALTLQQIIETFNGIVLFLTLIVIICYTFETYKQHKLTKAL